MPVIFDNSGAVSESVAAEVKSTIALLETDLISKVKVNMAYGHEINDMIVLIEDGTIIDIVSKKVFLESGLCRPDDRTILEALPCNWDEAAVLIKLSDGSVTALKMKVALLPGKPIGNC